MKIKFKKLSTSAVIPNKAHISDAGFDMTCTRFEVADGGLFTYHTDIAVEIPEGYVGLIFPRSSIYKHHYQVGDRIGQLIIIPYPDIEFVEADELSDSERGEGGYGSSGR